MKTALLILRQRLSDLPLQKIKGCFHIGDGAALALNSENKDDFVISRPQNGLFSCETFFIRWMIGKIFCGLPVSKMPIQSF